MQIGVETAKAVDNKRLFVVADDDITRMALQFMLHDENETHDLPTLEAAFDKSVAWKPDLLLLGIDVVRARHRRPAARPLAPAADEAPAGGGPPRRPAGGRLPEHRHRWPAGEAADGRGHAPQGR